MKIISIVSRKGGAGKTLLATNLAVALSQSGTHLIDLDPQASAAIWGSERSLDLPQTVATSPPLLGNVLSNAKKLGGDWAIVDTPPHQDGTAIAAAEVADLVLVPVRPTQADLDILPSTVKLLRLCARPAAFVINAAQPQAKPTDLIDILKSTGFGVVPVLIRQRAAYAQAFGDRLGVVESVDEKAAAEILQLCDWVNAWLGSAHLG